jgi:hypothetical protein
LRSNLDQIFKSQHLYSLAENPSLDKVALLSNALSRELDQQLGREQYVRLSFIPNSYFFHAIKSPRVVWLRFSLQLLEIEGVRFTKGNGASPSARVHDNLFELSFDWETMRRFRGDYSDQMGPVDYPRNYQSDAPNFLEEKNTWNSEILVPRSLSTSFCDGVYDALSGVRILIP